VIFSPNMGDSGIFGFIFHELCFCFEHQCGFVTDICATVCILAMQRPGLLLQVIKCPLLKKCCFQISYIWKNSTNMVVVSDWNSTIPVVLQFLSEQTSLCRVTDSRCAQLLSLTQIENETWEPLDISWLRTSKFSHNWDLAKPMKQYQP
jgi:hypothetical protein